MKLRRDENQSVPVTASRRDFVSGSAALGGAALIAAGSILDARPRRTAAQNATPVANGEVYQRSPWWPWLSAHIDNQNPPDVLGGPITTTVNQDEGPAFWVFPGPRRLDPTVFGTPEQPIGTEEPALFLGLPESMRTVTDDGVYQTSVPTPFGDDFASTDGASVQMTLVDATAIDGATTKDQVDFEATFTAPEDQGEYRVVASQAAPHGWVYPTGGGVVNDVILHGVTGWGTRLFPTIFTYTAFWGMGEVFKDGESVATERAIHVMVTEFARVEPYAQAFDEEVSPTNRHLHLQVAPFTAKGEMSPVPTGFMLPNGQEQPFLHVMFPVITMERTVGGQ